MLYGECGRPIRRKNFNSRDRALTLLRHHFRRYPNSYIEQQVYLNPHPPELMLRNLI